MTTTYDPIQSPIMNKIQEYYNKIKRAFAALGIDIEKILNNIAIFGGYLKSLWHKAQKKVEQLLDKLWQYFGNAGDAGQLLDEEKRLTTVVLPGMTSKIKIFEGQDNHAAGLAADETWKGLGAEAYQQTIPAQHSALIAYKSSITNLAGALHKGAWAIRKFWGAIAIGCAAFLGAIVTGAAMAGVGVVWGIVAGVVAFGVAIWAAIELAHGDMSDAASSLNLDGNDNSPWDGTGSWPKVGGARNMETGAVR